MLGKRIINTATGAAPSACTTDTVQILGDTSCIAYYKMSDATDQTGSYDGTPTNVNFNVAGKFGNAGEFNGSSSVISTSGNISGGQDFSISLWVYLNTDTNQQNSLFTMGSATNNGFFIYRYNELMALDSFGATQYVDATFFTENTWQHLVVTHSSGTNNIYLDGSFKATFSYTWNINATANTDIGAQPSASRYLNGKLDQVRIFNRAITANEVETLYNEVECIPTIVPTDNFNTVLYPGNNTGQSIVGVGFQPDFTWIKDRTTTGEWHVLTDSVRGTNSQLFSNDARAQDTKTTMITSFDSDGFSIGSDNAVNGVSSRNYVAWNWKAGGSVTPNNNTEGTITSTVSANPDAGFSIVEYTANATSGATIGHGLSQELDLLIVKSTNLSQAWNVYVKDVTDTSSKYLRLNETSSIADLITANSRFIPNNFTDSVFSVGNDNSTNGISGTDTYIAYCFHSVDGMSKIGSYVGTGVASGNSIVTGFRPRFVLIKRTDSAGDWRIFDSVRNLSNPINNFLRPNDSAAETTNSSTASIDFFTNGFEPNSGSASVNADGASYIFMAFAEEVFVPTSILETNRLIDLRVENYTSGNTWNDVSGQGNNAALSSPSQPTPDSLHFNFANLGAQNKYGGNNVSIEFYIKTTNTDDDYFLTAYNGGGLIPGEFLLYIPLSSANGKPYLTVSGSTSSASNLSFDHTVVQNDWTHYVLVYDSSLTGNTNRFTMYVNGSAVTTSVEGGVDNFDNSNFMGDTSTLFIGKRGGGTDYEEMDIKAFRIYDKSLSSLEVEENYNATTALT